MDTKIKICGLTNPAEVKFLADRNVKYAGIIMFYEKSKRNNSPETAKPIIYALKELEKSGIIIETVAVTVSPTLDQLRIIQELGFDIIQIHGELKDEVITNANIPIFRAYNILDNLLNENLINEPKVKGVLFDGKVPGGGKVFDWSLLKKFDKKGKLIILAGGLNESNVADGIKAVSPDIVDVSSGVEYLDEGKIGKDPERIKAFINAVVQTK